MSEAPVICNETRTEPARESQRLIKGDFARLVAQAPDGLRGADFRLIGGVAFGHVAIDGADVLPSLSTFRNVLAGIADRFVTPVTPLAAAWVGSHRCGGGR
ncbi:hypothetical protein ACIBEJ_51525 [Nonomuraea sp. NPDC050790]|uniref:hypothetical protein n=1 Tax=Nonomuraea sp. NPDC050790 TaxID=3364371 RepID=UPI00379BBD71